MAKGLDISDEDYQKIKSSSIILHVAASVRFDDSLKNAILMNTRGTVEVCELALKLKNLKAIVHVSTTYCNALRNTIDEKVYDNKNDWKTYIKYAETFSQEILDCLTPQ